MVNTSYPNEGGCIVPEIKERVRSSLTQKENKELLISLFKTGHSYRDIAEVTGIQWKSVRASLKRWGYQREYSPEVLTEVQKEEAIKLYNEKVPVWKIAKDFGCSIAPLYRLLKKTGSTKAFGVNIRKYEVNHDYFENIDSEDKAYFLGFMFADGYNRQVEKEKSIKLTLAIKDICVVESLRAKICPEKKFYINKRSLKNPNWQDSVALSVYSSKLSDDLAKWGCVQAKTHILTFPENLDPEFHRHFIRGYFDGDGCCNPKRFEIVGTIAFVEKVQEILMEKLGLNKTKLGRRHKDRDDTIRTLIYGGTNVTKRIYDYLYTDAEYFLERKKSKFNIN